MLDRRAYRALQYRSYARRWARPPPLPRRSKAGPRLASAKGPNSCGDRSRERPDSAETAASASSRQAAGDKQKVRRRVDSLSKHPAFWRTQRRRWTSVFAGPVRLQLRHAAAAHPRRVRRKRRAAAEQWLAYARAAINPRSSRRPRLGQTERFMIGPDVDLERRSGDGASVRHSWARCCARSSNRKLKLHRECRTTYVCAHGREGGLRSNPRRRTVARLPIRPRLRMTKDRNRSQGGNQSAVTASWAATSARTALVLNGQSMEASPGGCRRDGSRPRQDRHRWQVHHLYRCAPDDLVPKTFARRRYRPNRRQRRRSAGLEVARSRAAAQRRAQGLHRDRPRRHPKAQPAFAAGALRRASARWRQQPAGDDVSARCYGRPPDGA